MAPNSTSSEPTVATLISSDEKKSDARKHADMVIAVTLVMPTSWIPTVKLMYVFTIALPSAMLNTVD
jgi:hypothetical protein